MNNTYTPFYVYTDNNSLYIKNINSHTEKLCNNIFSYCANIDSDKKIHICCIDTSGKLIHITNTNNHWVKKIVIKVFNDIRNIRNMRLYIVNNFLNIFVTEKNPLDESLYRISHFNFSPKNYNLSKYHINNVLKENSSIYKLTTDSLNNFILQYVISNNLTRNLENKTLIFNSISRYWLTPAILPMVHDDIDNITILDIRDNLYEYSYSINYKL